MGIVPIHRRHNVDRSLFITECPYKNIAYAAWIIGRSIDCVDGTRIFLGYWYVKGAFFFGRVDFDRPFYIIPFYINIEVYYE